MGASRSRTSRIALFAALVIVPAAGAWTTSQVIDAAATLRDETRLLDNLREVLNRQTSQRQPAQARTKEQISEYNRVTHHLTAPWAAIFTLLERRVPRNVVLVSIEPDAARRTVRLEAAARTLDDLITFVDLLRADPQVARATALRHDTDDSDSLRPVTLWLELAMQDAQ